MVVSPEAAMSGVRGPQLTNITTEQLALLGRVIEYARVLDYRKRRNRMAVGCRVEYVEDRHAARLDGVGNERTVTAPGHGFRAHDCTHTPGDLEKEPIHG